MIYSFIFLPFCPDPDPGRSKTCGSCGSGSGSGSETLHILYADHTDQTATLTGWGRQWNDGPLADQLNMVKVPEMNGNFSKGSVIHTSGFSGSIVLRFNGQKSPLVILC